MFGPVRPEGASRLSLLGQYDGGVLNKLSRQSFLEAPLYSSRAPLEVGSAQLAFIERTLLPNLFLEVTRMRWPTTGPTSSFMLFSDGDVMSTFPPTTFSISLSLRVTSGDRRIRIPTKGPRILPLPVSCGSLLRPYFFDIGQCLPQEDQLLYYSTTHSVRLDNFGQTYPFHLEQERCGSSPFPKEVQKHLHI